MTTNNIVAVVPAAGVGSRMGADRPKQYLKLNGKTVIEHTLSRLAAHPLIHRVVVALSPNDDYFDNLPIAQADWLTRVDGGKERADSVLNALQTLGDNEWALVHDAARPCVLATDIDRLIHLALSDDCDGGILASPVRDTMKRATQDVSSTLVSHTESRDALWHALTPQLFQTQPLKLALEAGLTAGANITDEASAMEIAGYRVKLVNGNPGNIKITHPDDMPLASFYLTNIQDSLCE